ncbi:uncharacterized protein LOC119077195 isoform X2 [Bradysia coprophila]|uniref:uncharacterized protein LOC119077195 isoform X2 n=1 Tax=Bradysia coprophila TaxID=38358 RepID=UPI00187DD4C7|nr:uncharacterized protein LOC119077195 isoform X2 [Bradysia coprophila]
MRFIINVSLLKYVTLKFACFIFHFTCLNADIGGNQLRTLENGFWNVRVPFRMVGVEIGTHMSIIRLQNGRFLIIDTVAMNDELKHEFNQLTSNGSNIEAVVAVHPFHTLAYSAFHKLYPNVKYYGTPRHLRKISEIHWAGQLDADENKELLSKWAPEVELRIPDGAEYYNPRPEAINHFVSVFVYHSKSKTLHVDDTLIYIETSIWPINLLLQPGSLIFHPSLIIGLKPDAEAPLQFHKWMNQILKDWNIENLCTAHVGVKVGGAQSAIQKLVNDSEVLFQGISELHSRSRLFSFLVDKFSEPFGQIVEYLSAIIS